MLYIFIYILRVHSIGSFLISEFRGLSGVPFRVNQGVQAFLRAQRRRSVGVMCICSRSSRVYLIGSFLISEFRGLFKVSLRAD